MVVFFMAAAAAVSSQSVGFVLDGPETAYASILANTLEGQALSSGGVSPVIANAVNTAHEVTRREVENIAPGVDVVVAIGLRASEALAAARTPPSTATIGVFYGHDSPAMAAQLDRTISVAVDVAADIAAVERDFGIGVARAIVDDRLYERELYPAIPVPVDSFDVTAAAAGAVQGEGVYVMPLPHLTAEDQARLYGTLRDAGVIAVAADGREAAILGAALGYNAGLSQRVAREITLVIEELSLGPDAFETVTRVRATSALTLNTATLSAVGIEVPWTVVLEAEIVGMQSVLPRIPTLAQVIEQAFRTSPEVGAARSAADAQRAIADAAIAPLLPGITGDVTYVAIDEDRAEGSTSPYQYEASLGTRLEQVVWSEPAWANLRVQRLLSDAQDLTAASQRADTALEVAEAYYDLSRSIRLVEIRRQTARRTRENLELAQLQQRVGEGSQLDVLRFENQVAQDNIELIDATNQVRLASGALATVVGMAPARLLRGSLPGRASGPAVTSGFSLDEIEALLGTINTFRGADALEQFAATEALARSESLAIRELTITIRDRERTSAARQFYSPTVSAFVELEHTFYEAGAGGGSEIQIAPGATLDTDSFSSADATDLTAGFSLTLPLFSGTERLGRVRESESNLELARQERAITALAVDQYARSAASSVVAAYNRLQQSRIGEETALETLSLVQEAYIVGAASSSELLDAQNSAAVAAQQTGSIEAELQTDWARLLRATGAVDALVSDQGAEEFTLLLRNATGGSNQ